MLQPQIFPSGNVDVDYLINFVQARHSSVDTTRNHDFTLQKETGIVVSAGNRATEEL